MYLLYSLLYVVALLFILPFEYFKRPRQMRQKWLKEKFGFLSASGIENRAACIWVHAVSVGEVMAAIPLLGKLKATYPNHRIILSTITDTGQKVAREKSPDGIAVIYLPLDVPCIIRSALRKVSPRLLIIVETELWPNLLKVFKENGIPVILLNGRISEKSFHGYSKLPFFISRILSFVESFGMQNGEYAERLRRLGADSKKIQITGSFKFDADPPKQTPLWTSFIGKPVIVAGSTHEGEEDLIAQVYTDLRKEFPDMNLIIAPRHPERFGRVEEILSARGIPFLKRSELHNRKESRSVHGSIILLDSIGELSSVYGIATIAVIGKSFRGLGGQNPLEPAFWGIPMVCGTHMENFPFMQDFYRAGAAIEVTEEALFKTLRELLLSPDHAREIGLKAQTIYQQNTGAVEKAMEIIEKHLRVS